MPNAAAVFAVLTVLYCLVIFDAPRQLFRDSDSGWHIRTGETILRTARLPVSDPYSFSRPGAQWFAWEWGADVLMGFAHQSGGLRGVVLLYAAAIGLVTWLWFQLHWAAGSGFLVACAMLPPMLSTASLHWLARPHVFGWIALLVTLIWAERGLRRPGWAVILGCVWANLHASFFLGPVVLAAYGLGEWLRRKQPPVHHGRAIAGFLVGSLINPYGWQVHGHIIRYLLDQELLARVAEFQTFNFHTPGAGQIALTLGLAAVGATLALRERRWDHALLLALFAVIALRSARGLPVLAVGLLPLAAASITQALPWPQFHQYAANLRAIDARLPAWPAIPAVALLLATLAGTPGFPAREFPVDAVRSIPPDARLFAPDKFGGYLIYRFQGSLPVFFDGRSDFYGLDFLKQYIRMVEVRPGWSGLFDQWRFTHALVAQDAPLRAALEARGWRKVAEDQAAVLLAGPEATARRGEQPWTGRK